MLEWQLDANILYLLLFWVSKVLRSTCLVAFVKSQKIFMAFPEMGVILSFQRMLRYAQTTSLILEAGKKQYVPNHHEMHIVVLSSF